jgi:pantothenate kinase
VKKNSLVSSPDSFRYGLDLGGSTIDLVIFDIAAQQIQSYKTLESKNFPEKKLSDILSAFGIVEAIFHTKKLTLTGGHSSFFPEKFFLETGKTEIFLEKISEFEAIAKGGMFLSQKKSGLVVSLGTGTAMVSVENIEKNIWEHAGGTGIGGGTFLGLSRALLGCDDFSRVQTLSQKGDLENVDISVGEIIGGDIGHLTADMTASNFGKFSGDFSQPQDIALGIANMVGQSIASLAVEKARRYGHSTIILGGKFSRLRGVVECIEKTAKLFDVQVITPENSGFMTAVGGVLGEREIIFSGKSFGKK